MSFQGATSTTFPGEGLLMTVMGAALGAYLGTSGMLAPSTTGEFGNTIAALIIITLAIVEIHQLALTAFQGRWKAFRYHSLQVCLIAAVLLLGVTRDFPKEKILTLLAIVVAWFLAALWLSLTGYLQHRLGKE